MVIGNFIKNWSQCKRYISIYNGYTLLLSHLGLAVEIVVVSVAQTFFLLASFVV
jgi:hypothetical protein